LIISQEPIDHVGNVTTKIEIGIEITTDDTTIVDIAAAMRKFPSKHYYKSVIYHPAPPIRVHGSTMCAL